MKRIFIFIILILISISVVEAQQNTNKESNKESAKTTANDKVFYGGGLGVSFESNYWMINVAPMIGYKFTPSLHGGISVLYAYESYTKQNPDYNINSYGAGAFLRYDLGTTLMKDMPFSIFFQTDYEGRQEEVKFKNAESYGLKNYSEFRNYWYLGAGYSQSMGGRVSAYVMASIDLLRLNDENIRPLIRAGIQF